jgi:hypothetical protein
MGLVLPAQRAGFFGCFVLSSLGFNHNPVLMPVGGLWQRLTLVVGLSWLAALALHVRRGRHRQLRGRHYLSD